MSSCSRLRVAVIGAGAAGLAALRHLTAHPNTFQAQAFEMTPFVSGTWVYTERIGTDERGLPLHSSMYKNLRTNLPKEVMAFPGFPFPKHQPSFVTHQQVRQYLEAYADHYNLRQFIQFNKKVNLVAPTIGQGGSQTWNVDVQDVTDQQSTPEKHEFDAVIVCNGHYAIPLMPNLPGLSTFTGHILHSHDYRVPEMYDGKRVAVLGAAASGQDTSIDISSHAEQVYLCHRNPPLKTVLPDNLSQTCAIKEVRPSSIILEDGKELQIDCILFCTGYYYDFHFLSPECKLEIEDERVWPVYKHIIHTRYPTLSFIGLCKQVCPFPQFDCQALFVLAALKGDMVLPSKKEMEDDIEKDYQWRLSEGMPKRYAHKMGTLQWGYNDELAQLAGFTPIPRVVRTLYDYVHETRVMNVPTYKRFNYELMSDTEFKQIER